MNDDIVEKAINGIDEKLIGKHVERKCNYFFGDTNQKPKGGTNMKLKSAQSKWFIAFVVAAVIAVAAIVVAIVMGSTPKEPDEIVPVAGPEAGVYYYDTVDGEITLTLSEGCKFTISGPKTNKTGTYVVDGTNITLDFFKDEDGTTTATINGESVALVYDNATMTFLKKVPYTVDFNTNGGSSIDSATVINGKTVAQPADPIKESCVFLGWYEDEALTTPFDFHAATVKANTTVYARWAQKQVGVAEYMVNFDLGYEGAGAIEPITTIGGIAYGVADPEREGYTFGGWWISMYEDGQKLSYAYTEQTVFTADTTLFAVWHENGSSKLNAPAVSVTEGTISWNAVKDAASYKLTVIDPDGNVVIDNETVIATTKTFDFASAKAGEYKISVVAVASKQENNSEPAERYFANKALNRVSSFTVENGILIFNAVENAQRYAITIDCGNENHVHTAFDNGSSTTYYIANCPMQDGGILITVTASANGYTSSTSRVFVYNKVLDKIDQIVYDKDNDVFVWDAVAGTAAYQVTVKVSGKEYSFNNGTNTSFSIAGFTGDIEVSVIPVTEGYNSPEATVATCKKTAPAAPDGLMANGMVITWNAVEGATAYEVNIGGQTLTVNTNQLNLADGTATLTQGQNYTVKVKAINAGNESSAYSEPMEVGYFVMGGLSYTQNTVSWTPVLGVNMYQIRVNEGGLINVTDVNSVKIKLTKEGENLIEVRYVDGESVSEWASITVTAFAVEYDTRSVTHGSFYIEYLAVGDLMGLPTEGFSYDGYEFSGWYNAPKGAAGNGKEYTEGAVFGGNAYTVVYAEWTPKDYNVTLKTEGFDITNIENEQTQTVKYSTEFTLPVPEVVDAGIYFFAGWYTGPSGTGLQITDAEGVCVNPYNFPRDITLYPYYSTNALGFVLQADGTYAVTKGSSIAGVTHLKIPVSYNEIPVTKIMENAFANNATLVEVEIPDTITLVGSGAFTTSTALQSIDVYKAKEGVYETFYSSVDGVLLRQDMGVYYLECVPRAKTGAFEIPDTVQKIPSKAFYNCKLESVTIPNSVVDISKYAFYQCYSLKNITFVEGRTNPTVLPQDAIYQCTGIETLNFPANLDMAFGSLQVMLRQIPALKAINVEDGGTTYGSVGGMLTNKEKDKILMCPMAYAGDLRIPNGISTIGNQAFYECDKITSITIPSWVTTIENNAFDSSDGYHTLTFEGSRKVDLSIGQYAFKGAANLQTIVFAGNGTTTLDAGKVTIGNFAFDNANGNAALTSVQIGAGVNIASIGDKAFYQKKNLKTFTIDDYAAIGTIGNNVFEGCASLQSFTVPASVTSIGSYAFSECASLREILFKTEGATALAIGDYAFNNCGKLKTITLPDHLTAFKSSSFVGCNELKQISVNATNPKYVSDANGVLYGKDANGNLAELLFYPKGLASELNGVINNLPATLTAIGGAAFYGNDAVVHVTIPASVTVIDNSAFENCSNLETVTFAASGTALTIGEKAFLNCAKLTDQFRLPAYTTTIGVAAFQGCTFTSFVIPEGVTEIGKAAFYGMTTLQTLEFKCTGALTIADGSGDNTSNGGAFSGCTALKTVVLPTSTVRVGHYAFYKCSALESITFGKVTVTENAQGEKVYTTESDLVAIGNYAFGYCVSLKSLVIPKTVTAIGQQAFGMANATNHGALEEVNFELGGTELLNLARQAFIYQPNLKRVNFPARINFYTNITSQVKDANNNDINKPHEIGDTMYSRISSDIFAGCTALAEINVAVEEGVEARYASLDGVLYSADMKVLVCCPVANVGRVENGNPTYELIVPNTVELVMTNSFFDVNQLKTLRFQEFDKEDEHYGNPILTISAFKNVSNNANNSAIGGNTSSITDIYLPSHLGKVGGAAFANKGEVPVNIHFNPDATNVELAQYAFNYAKVVKLNLPGIKAIGQYTFANNNFLEEVTFDALDSAVTALPNNCFFGCTALKTVEIPAQITQIGQQAFSGCASLKELVLPEGLTSMGQQAFKGAGLVSVTIPSTVTASGFGNYLFDSCASLTTVRFALDENGNSLITKIPQYCFQKCTALVDINLYDLKLTSIDNGAFNGCTAITDVDFTKLTTLTAIGTTAFSGTSLVNVDLSKTALTQVNTSFSDIATLKTLIFPAGATAIANNAFKNCTALESVVVSAALPGVQLVRFNQSNIAAQIIIPENNPNIAVDKYGVVYDPTYQTIYFASVALDLSEYQIPSTVLSISTYAFAYNQTLGDFVIPNGVTDIGNNAFYMTGMKSITIPASVTKIGNYAFQGSTMEEVIFADEHNSQLASIGNYAFSKTMLKRIVLPDNLSSVGTYVFSECPQLVSVTTGANLKTLNTGFVAYSKNLEELVLQEGLEKIQWIFSQYSRNGQDGTNRVTTIHIPSTVKSLEASAFCDFRNLTTVTIAQNSQLANIKQYAFYENHALETINLGRSVTTIDQYTFYNCKSLKTLDLSQTGVTTINQYTFANTESLRTLVLPSNLMSIGNYAFQYTGACDVVIPDSVTSIGTYAFEGAAIKSLTFGNDSMLTTLPNYSFRNTENLKTVVLPNGLLSIGTGTFQNSGVETVTFTDSTATTLIGTIGDFAFADCVNLTGFDYLHNTTSIGEAAFLNCVNLEAATVHEGIKTMGAMAFGFCTKLTAANIPATVTTLGGNPYGGLEAGKINLDADNKNFVAETNNGVLTIYDSLKENVYGVFGASGAYDMGNGEIAYMAGALAGNGITQITLPAKFATVENYMFMNCDKLANITFEGEITGIGKYAFYNTELAAFTIPGTVTTVGDWAFAYCDKLDNVVVAPEVKTLGNYCFAFCTTLHNFTFETGTVAKTLGTHFFYHCPNITQVILPEKFGTTSEDAQAYGQFFTQTIPSYMFAGTGIVEAVIPKTNSSLHFTAGVFADCKNLERIVFQYSFGSNAATQKDNRLNATWIDGCDKFQYFYVEYFYDTQGYAPECMYFSGINELHMGTVFESGEDANVKEFNVSMNRFGYVGEDFRLYFHKATWEEIIVHFENLTTPWKFRIIDKNGYQLVCSEEDGSVAYVLDALGNKVWEKNAE